MAGMQLGRALECSGCLGLGFRGLACFSRLRTPLLLYSLLSLNHYLLVKFSTVLPVKCDGFWGRVFLAGGAHGWDAIGAGTWVFWLFVN